MILSSMVTVALALIIALIIALFTIAIKAIEAANKIKDFAEKAHSDIKGFSDVALSGSRNVSHKELDVRKQQSMHDRRQGRNPAPLITGAYGCQVHIGYTVADSIHSDDRGVGATSIVCNQPIIIPAAADPT